MKQAGSYTLDDFQHCYGTLEHLTKGMGDKSEYIKEKIVTHLEPKPDANSKEDAGSGLEETKPSTEIVEKIQGKRAQPEEMKKEKINLFANEQT